MSFSIDKYRKIKTKILPTKNNNIGTPEDCSINFTKIFTTLGTALLSRSVCHKLDNKNNPVNQKPIPKDKS